MKKKDETRKKNLIKRNFNENYSESFSERFAIYHHIHVDVTIFSKCPTGKLLIFFFTTVLYNFVDCRHVRTC